MRRAAALRDRMPPSPLKPSLEQIAGLFRERNPEFFRDLRRTFFMCDLFEEHEERFQVVYER